MTDRDDKAGQWLWERCELKLAELFASIPKPHNVADDEPNPQDGMEDE